MRRTRKPRELRSALASKGFRHLQNDHTKYFLYVRGLKTPITTKVGHHSYDYDIYLLDQMAKQLRLHLRELDKFVECPLTHEGYVKLLEERGHV